MAVRYKCIFRQKWIIHINLPILLKRKVCWLCYLLSKFVEWINGWTFIDSAPGVFPQSVGNNATKMSGNTVGWKLYNESTNPRKPSCTILFVTHGTKGTVGLTR